MMPTMRARKSGSIVNIASVVAVAGQPGYLHDVASKRAVLAMIARTNGLAKEVGQHGARVKMPVFFASSAKSVGQLSKPQLNNNATRLIKLKAFRR